MRERDGHRAIMLKAAELGARLFRNNVGIAHTPDGRAVHFGLCNGSADDIGWKTIMITPEMVGQRIAVFVSIEEKRPGKDTTSRARRRKQDAWAAAVREAGGIAGKVRDAGELEELLR